MAYLQSNPELDPTKVPSDIEIAWAAGIFEGEGTIHERRYASAGAFVTQKDPEILYRLRDWFGGSVRFATCKTVPVANSCHRWSVCGHKARFFVAVIYGFMSARRKAQIDATRTLDFMAGQSPIGMGMAEIREALVLFENARYSTKPYDVRRRETLKSKPWYIKRRASSKGADTAQERVM